MKIKESAKLKEKLLKKARDYLAAMTAKRAKGLHLSDLLTPRQAYWREIDPQPISEDQIGYFIAGHGHHYIIEAIAASKPTNIEVEYLDKALNVYVTIDVMEKDSVVEVKSNRAAQIKSEPNETYIDQIQGQCAMTGKTKANLIVFYLCPDRKKNKTGSKPRFQVFEISFTKKELKEIREVLEERVELLKEAKETNNHSALPLCPEWMCIGCPWVDQCKPEEGVYDP